MARLNGLISSKSVERIVKEELADLNNFWSPNKTLLPRVLES